MLRKKSGRNYLESLKYRSTDGFVKNDANISPFQENSMKEISYADALEYVNSLPALTKSDASLFPDLSSSEQHVLRIAIDLFQRLGFRNPKSFLDGIFVAGKQFKQRDFNIIKQLLNGKKNVLDAGCGWGGLTRILLDVGQSVIAADHVFEHANATKLLCPEATVFQANAMEMPFIQSESIDVSILMGVIEHVGLHSVPRGFSGTNVLCQYKLVQEMSRVTAADGYLFLNTGNALFPRDGETNLWFYHWLPLKEQNLYNELTSISSDDYWLLTWEELSLILNLCGFEVSCVQSPDAEDWNRLFMDRLDLCFSGLNNHMKDAIRRLVAEDPRYFSSWNIYAKKARPSTPLESIDFSLIKPSLNYLPYHLLLSRVQSAENSINYSISLRDLSNCCDKKSIWIWGTGEGGKKALPLLQAASMEVKGFIDSNRKKDGSLFQGMPIHSPDTILKDRSNNAYVFIASVFVSEIETQLEKYGYQYIRDYFVLTTRYRNSENAALP
jgi:SAM-dependent methyltransferase